MMKGKPSRVGFLFSILCCAVVINCISQKEDARKLRDLSKDSSSVSIPFYSGMNGYHAFRIPTLIKTQNTLMAFAEGRKNSTSDFGDIDLVCRRSQNNGRTWEPMQVLHDLDTMAVQNPVPVFIKEENKVVLLFNTTSMREHDVLNKDYELKDERKAYLTTSADGGKNWSAPRDITRDVKRKHWRWHALGPVHGIELQYGKHRGRLVVPVAISIEKGNTAYCMALIYSDDAGSNWQIGAVDENLADAVRCNETTIAQLPDGRIYVNTRDHTGGSPEMNRGETFSLDGGLTFQKPIIESDKFPSPIVQSALLSWNGEGGQLLFSTPSTTNKRENLIIMRSDDHAKSWYELFKVHDGFSAYSDMVKLDDQTLGVIYETDDYKKIRFRRINIE